MSFIDINIAELKKEGIKLIVFDFDNTLTNHGSEILKARAIQYLEYLKKESFMIFILSNAKKDRINKALNDLEVDGRGQSFKPIPIVLNKVIKSYNVTKKEVVLIGDQIFTDIAAGNLAGVKTILVERISDKESLGIRIRRRFESVIQNGSKKID